jgi:hypothetical protein
MEYFSKLPKEYFYKDTKSYLINHDITRQITAATCNVKGNECIVVYQAFNKQIAEHAVQYQTFENCEYYNMNRMTWIKTNFLWMMYRSNYAQKKNQERILALFVNREFFDQVILGNATLSQYPNDLWSNPITNKSQINYLQYYPSRLQWKKESGKKPVKGYVRMQWDPYHDPQGEIFNKSTRAIQLGLKGENILHKMMKENQILKIEDITPFVKDQYATLKQDQENILIPVERFYQPNGIDKTILQGKLAICLHVPNNNNDQN